ncbi:MAG TPA: 2-oxoacid:acceptor oxidoreductase subunit alpha [Thermoanaerobaculia bacterium]|nr:2-oxoacid:acceptor oxidoreductase subunit alpha [Thermoanaerobaculia bacterium]
MSSTTPTRSVADRDRSTAANRRRQRVDEAIVEIVSDSGEGAQKAGQTFGIVSAKMGNGVWTVEIIPAEIKPPARSRAGASGIRVRLGCREIRNMGDEADLVVAFNEQVLYGRIEAGAYRTGTVVLLESRWAEDPDEHVRELYATALEDFARAGLVVVELPLEEACRAALAAGGSGPPVGRFFGKNMFVVGMLAQIYERDLDKTLEEVRFVFAKKPETVVETNLALVRAGWEYAAGHVDLAFEVPPTPGGQQLVVMNGNQAIGLGVLAAGIDVLAMYPITPATSVSHYLAAALPRCGGIVHQAEDEIAAIGFALGASYAGKTACTVTSGPGLALKTEFLGLAVMGELPLVMIVVQRGGPSTGLPTKVEQGDLLAVLFGAPGDSPKIVIAPSSIEECFHFVITARRLAEELRTPVIVLSDANLATGVQPFPRPRVDPLWLPPEPDQSPWPEGIEPYAWDPRTGVSPRAIPGQRGGEYVLTGLAHTRGGKVAYDAHSNQDGCDRRSRKLATLAGSLKPPEIYGDPEGDLLLVGWGSTRGSIEEAVDRLRAQDGRVSAVHLRFLSPMEPGLEEIFARFAKVMTIELNYSDPPDARGPRRYAQLATLLRAQTLVDVDCWSEVSGQPLPPGAIVREVSARLDLPAAVAG